MSDRSRRLLALVGGLVTGLALALGAWAVGPRGAGPLPRTPAPSFTLADRHGLALRTTRAPDGSLARWLPLSEMDPKILQAFLALEDRRFYEHGAMDWRAAIRAARDNLRAGHVVSGASTVTMQLARLLRPAAGGAGGAGGRTW